MIPLPVLFQALLFASSGLLAIGSVSLVILLLLSNEALNNAFYYVSGYVISYTIIALLIVMLGYQLAGGASEGVRFVFSWVLIFMGCLLVVLGVRNWRHSSSSQGREGGFRLGRIMEGITPRKALGVGLLVPLINFKNLALFLTAISVITVSQLSFLDQVLGVVLVIVVFCFSVILPIIIYVLFPSEREKILRDIKHGLNQHSRMISIIVPIIFGFILFLKGVSGVL